MEDRKIWYEARKEMKMVADFSRYHGWIAMERTAQIKKPARMETYLGTE
jgi:hypothetical protein